MLISELKIESCPLVFSNQDSKVVAFEVEYTTIPTVTGTAMGNVNVYIKNLTTKGCTVATSQVYSGIVSIHVVG